MGKASKKKKSLSPAIRDNKKEVWELSNSPAKENIFYKQLVHLIFIAVVGLLAYSNTFKGPFQWDEEEYILNNPVIRDLGYFLSPSHVEGSWLYYILKSRYIGYLTFALNYRLHGYDVAGYHVVNLAIHIIDAILVYFLVSLTIRTPFFGRLAVSRGRRSTKDKPVPDSFESQGTHDDFLSSPAPNYQSRIARLMPLAVALLFVAHPVQTEAVTYVFQRLASLVSMFYMLSLVLYIKGRSRQVQAEITVEQKAKRGFASAHTFIWFFLSFLAALLAMKTKENAFTLPVVMTLYEFLFFTGTPKSRLLRLVPFLLTMLIVPLTLLGTGSSAGELMSQIQDPQSLGYHELSREDYLFTQFRVIVTYIRLLFLPINQNINYDYPLYRSFFDPPVLLSFMILASLFCAAIYLLFRPQAVSDALREHNEQPAVDGKQLARSSTHPSPYFRLVGFGILWFFITLSVESSVIPIPLLINEYRVYLPSVGFFLAVTAGIMILIRRFAGKNMSKGQHSAGSMLSDSRFLMPSSHERRLTAAAVIVFTAVVLALTLTTYARNEVWKDKVSLWEDVIRKSPNSPTGYNNLGIAYFQKGQYAKAIAMYERCIELRPDHRDVHINLGVVYATTGQLDKAIDQFRLAIAIEPMNSAAYYDLARAYVDAGQSGASVEAYLKAIELNPYNSVAYHGLGTSYMRLGRIDDALTAFSKFVSLSPYDPAGYRNRGIAFNQKGDVADARADFQKACSLGSTESCNDLRNPQPR